MTYWYVAQPDKSLSVEITRRHDGSYGIGGYLRLYKVDKEGNQGALICTINLSGVSEVPDGRIGAGQESGASSGESDGPGEQQVRLNNVHPGVRARTLAALESDQESVQGEETGETGKSN